MKCKKCGELYGKVFCENCKNARYESFMHCEIFSGCNLIEEDKIENNAFNHVHIIKHYDNDVLNKENNCKYYQPNFWERIRIWCKENKLLDFYH